MTTGAITSLSLSETNQTTINFAIQQLLQRNGGQQVNASVATTVPYTVKTSDFMVEISGDTEVTLLSASAAAGQIYCFKKIDAAGSTGTITPASTADLIDGSTKSTLTSSYQVLMIQSNAMTWDTIIKSTAVDLSPFLKISNALSELSTNAAAARGNIGVLGSSQVLQISNSLSELSTAAATARTNISAAAISQSSFADGMTGYVNSPVAANAFDVYGSAPFGATITKITARSLSGSGKAVFAINGTAVTGGAVSFSTAVASVSPTSSNVFATGDVVTFTTTTVSSPSQFYYTLALSRSVTLS